MNVTEYVLKGDGGVIRRVVTEQELDVSASIMEAFAKNACFKVPNIQDWNGLGMLGCGAVSGYSYWTLKLKRLPIRCPWRLVGQYMVPVFNSSTDPIMEMIWTPPADCLLKLVMRVVPRNHSTMPITMNGVWFCAMDTRGAMWRLPLPNVHDDCMVCTGHDTENFPCIYDGLHKFITTFHQSRYNADLWKNVELTQQFFRMLPTKDGFDTVAPDGTWTTYCTKISNAIAPYIV